MITPLISAAAASRVSRLRGFSLSGSGQIDRSFAPETIKRFRKQFALTQQGLGDLLGVSKFTVTAYEKKGAPRWVRFALVGLAEIHFGVPREELGWLGRLEPLPRERRPLRVAEGPPAPDPTDPDER